MYFLLVNKLKNLGWASTTLDSTLNTERTVAQLIDITATTIFTTIPTGIQLYPFTKDFTMLPDINIATSNLNYMQ